MADLVRSTRRTPRFRPRRRAALLVVVVALALAQTGGLVDAGTPAAATDVCPTLLVPGDLPDELRALPVPEGASLSDVAHTLAALQAMGLLRQVPAELPSGVEEAWVWQSGYLPREAPSAETSPEPPTEPAWGKPGGPATYTTPEGATTPYEAWVCLRAKVPDATGLPIEEALDAVRARGLDPEVAGIGGMDLDVATEAGWEVAALEPSPDTLLPFSDIVVVTVGLPGPDSSPRAPSPESGGSSAAAREDAARSGTGNGDGTGADVSTREDVGTTGTGDVGRLMTDQAPWSWAVLLALLALVAAAAAGLRRRARRRRQEPHVATRVRDGLPRTELTELRGLGRSHSVRIQAHRDEEEATLQPVAPAAPENGGPPVPEEPDRG